MQNGKTMPVVQAEQNARKSTGIPAMNTLNAAPKTPNKPNEVPPCEWRLDSKRNQGRNQKPSTENPNLKENRRRNG
jgi:hypothetical protein